MTATKTENNGETLNLDTLANEIKARIAAACKMQTKVDEIENGAALMLLQAKAHFKGQKGAYGQWLKLNEINARTASRLMAEHVDPAKRGTRKAANNERNKKARAKAEKAKSAAEGAKAGNKDDIRTEVLRVIGGLDADAIAAVYGFLVAEGMTGETEEAKAA